MLCNLNGCLSVSLIIVFISCIVVIISNIEYRSYIIDMYFLSVGFHSIAGTICIGKCNYIVSVAAQCNVCCPLICSFGLCPGNILSNSVYCKNRSRSYCFIFSGLKTEIEVCFFDSKLYLSVTLSVVYVIVFSYLIISKGILVSKSGSNCISYKYVLIFFFRSVGCFINNLN